MKRIFLIACCSVLISIGASSSVLAATTVPHPGESKSPSRTALAATRSQASSADMWFVGLLGAVMFLGNLALFAFVIVHHYPHTLSFGEADDWESPQYLRDLPNVLRHWSLQRFSTIWPTRCNPWSERRAERALRKTLQPLLRKGTERFVIRHMSAWRWMVSHREALQEEFHRHLERRARELLPVAHTQRERTALLAFVNSRDSSDVRSYPDHRTRLRLQNLKRVQILMREHGYGVAPELDRIDRLGQMAAEQLADWLILYNETQQAFDMAEFDSVESGDQILPIAASYHF